MKASKIFILLTFVSITAVSYAQRNSDHSNNRPANGHRQGRTAVVKHSRYRPVNLVVYHPHWRPAYDYHRRWVYFPAYNMYWDNWRNHYVYISEGAWVSRPTAPPVVINTNLETEKSFELKENEDDMDDIYKLNTTHKNEYKTD